jgi:hypothetical protein
VVPAASAGAPPELTGDARAVWDEALPALIEAGVVTAVDVGRAARTCRWEAAGRSLLAEAERLAGKRRGEVLRLAATCHALADKSWTALGIGSPGERNRMRLPPQEVDELAAFKAKHA